MEGTISTKAVEQRWWRVGVDKHGGGRRGRLWQWRHAADWFLLSRGSVWDYGLSLVWEEIGLVYVERYYSRREKQIKSTNYSIGSVFLSQIHTYIPRTRGPFIGLHWKRRRVSNRPTQSRQKRRQPGIRRQSNGNDIDSTRRPRMLLYTSIHDRKREMGRKRITGEGKGRRNYVEITCTNYYLIYFSLVRFSRRIYHRKLNRTEIFALVRSVWSGFFGS